MFRKFHNLLYSRFTIRSIISDKVFLSFDDGPEEGITEYVLDLLNRFHAKATFFCVGNNIEKHPHLYKRIIRSGHSVGNHTMSHLNGKKTPFFTYVNEIWRFRKQYHTKLLRPPYGSLSFSQLIFLKLLKYKIILWDVDSTDWYDLNANIFNVEDVIRQIHPGCIVLFHFRQKHESRTRIILPLILEYCRKMGYTYGVFR